MFEMPPVHAVDLNESHVLLSPSRFSQRESQHPVLERNRYVVLVDIVDGDPLLESTVCGFGVCAAAMRTAARGDGGRVVVSV